MSARKRKLDAYEPSPRAAIGLEQAMNGDLRGVVRFLQFIRSEIAVLRLDLHANLPPTLRIYLGQMETECSRAEHFAEGYIEAKSQKRDDA
jgi:hypothetical protein